MTHATQLRPHVQLELTMSAHRLPTVRCEISSFVSEVAKRPPELRWIECISVNETAAEKLVSLTRRTAGHLEGTRSDIVYDRWLVRHIYDLHHAIGHIDPDVVTEVARTVALDDAEQFVAWYPDYQQDPSAWTLRAIDWLASSHESRVNYRRFLDEMVFGAPVDYDEALASVADLARAMWKPEPSVAS
ncbi:MAG TPA: nucleotidyl transferase AbiEii/AbiGii toxin family protein [Candidatus Omnitrophota bacterium]|nr:nucleotidyl transferase AbiEii/AbiGii toxin family protein [Candidatus Omnitrophota bacterium]